MIIRNRDQLLSHGNIEGRRLVLDILEAGIDAADPYENVYNLIRIEDNKLIVGNERFPPGDWFGMTPPPGTPPRTGEPLVFDLSEVGNIYVVGGGKAAQRQALAIENVLGDRITEGHINAKKGDSVYLKRIGVSLAGHPLPDEESVSGSRRIYEIQHKARKGDIVFLSESGGGTSLMALPAPGISLADLQEVYRLLYFECGAPMPVANAVRNQLTILRGLHPRDTGEATLIHIYTTETPPDLRVHTNERPSAVDAYQHAIDILKEYGIWDQVAESVRAFLLRADPAYAPLRPEEWYDGRKHSFRVMGPEYMLEGARLKAEELGCGLPSWCPASATSRPSPSPRPWPISPRRSRPSTGRCRRRASCSWGASWWWPWATRPASVDGARSSSWQRPGGSPAARGLSSPPPIPTARTAPPTMTAASSTGQRSRGPRRPACQSPRPSSTTTAARPWQPWATPSTPAS